MLQRLIPVNFTWTTSFNLVGLDIDLRLSFSQAHVLNLAFWSGSRSTAEYAGQFFVVLEMRLQTHNHHLRNTKNQTPAFCTQNMLKDRRTKEAFDSVSQNHEAWPLFLLYWWGPFNLQDEVNYWTKTWLIPWVEQGHWTMRTKLQVSFLTDEWLRQLSGDTSS